MVERYPDTLVLKWKKAATFDEATGNWTAGEEVEKTIKGRADSTGSGSLIGLEDGTQVVFSFVFVAQKQHFTAPFNADANLNKGEWIGKIKRHVNHQTNARIWM